MRFSDIQKFPECKYHEDVALYRIPRVLASYDQDYGLDMNPDFQRGHVWTLQQKIDYVEFILRGGKSAREFYFNCGSWDGAEGTDIPKMTCVDGLQRLTALVEFINDKFPAFGYKFSEYEDNKRMCDYTFRFEVNNLKRKSDVIKWYIGMNTGGSKHTEKDIQIALDVLSECE